MVDLAEEADHVTVLHRGQVVHTGVTASFLAYAPDGTARRRAGSPKRRTTRCYTEETPTSHGPLAWHVTVLPPPRIRILHDAAAAKLRRAFRADPDPLSRLNVELSARQGEH